MRTLHSKMFILTALIFRGLDALTTEETITAAVARLSQIALKNCKVIRDEATGTSKGFCFVELNSIQVR